MNLLFCMYSLFSYKFRENECSIENIFIIRPWFNYLVKCLFLLSNNHMHQ
jgi:hypothetical protein